MVIATAQANDVVFLVEATTNMEASFSELKSNYIIPILNYFSPAAVDDLDLLVDSGSNLYTIATFTSADSAPYPSVSCAQPSTNSHEMHEAFGFIDFMQCWNFGVSHVTEAMATGLQILDEYKKIRSKPSQPVEKHIILICNSSPYDVPTRETRAYLGLYATDLADKMAERGVHLSIISPRKRPNLYQLFKRVSNPTPPLPNYAVDARHHILLDSITLKEQPRVEKSVKSIIELDNSPNPDLKPPSPTLSSHSILESQLKDAHARSTASSFVPTTGVSVASRTQDSTTAMAAATQVAPLLTEILESAGSNSNVDNSPNSRAYFSAVTPQTSAGAINIGQVNQITHSRPGNPNQVPLSNANNQQLNQKMPGNTLSVANSAPQATTHIAQQSLAQATNQMINTQTSMAGQPSQMPANSMANNQQMMKNTMNPTSIGVSKGMVRGNITSNASTINSGGLRQSVTRHPNMQNSLSQGGGQFNRAINPSQVSQQYTQPGQQLLQNNPGLMQQQPLPNQQISVQNQLQSTSNIPQQQQLSQQQIPQGQQMQQGQLQQGQIQQGQMQQGQLQQGQMQQGQMQQSQVQQGQMSQGQMPQSQMPQGQMPQGQMSQGQMSQGQLTRAPQQNKLPGQVIQNPLQLSQHQVVWQGSLEFCERRANTMSPSERMLVMPCKLMADPFQDSDLISSGGLFKWPQKISVYPIPEVILTQSPECKRQLTTDTRKLNIFADTNHSSPFRSFVTMLIEKGMAGVINMNAQNEYQIMVLFAPKQQAATSNCAMRAFLPRQQALFYDEFKKSVQLYKEKTKIKTVQAQNLRGQAPSGQMGGTMPNHMSPLNQPQQMTSRLPNQAGQRQVNPNLQQVIIGSNTNQQGFPSTGQMNQGGMQQSAGMHAQSQQMASMGGQSMMNQQIGSQRTHQNTHMLVRPQMVQQIVQPRQPGQQTAGQQLAGQQLAGQQLTGQQLAGQQLAGQQLAGQQLAGQQLAGQQMQKQQLQNQQLQNQQLQSQQLQSQQLQNQQLQNQQLQNQQLQNQQLQNQQMQNQQMQNQQMQNQQMQNQQMQSQQMQNQQLQNQQMQSQQLQNQQMQSQQLQNQQMQNQQLQNQQLLMQPNKQSQLLMGGQGQQLDDLQGIFNG
ncbi:mediator of RNA polymerase II transcription subunit 25-like isoform X2 [Watersipora subatra]|uniref:mediator of RNA polymerase II transcription subunit 25-like isoform X2 n=1 Tax=Watersipora subatra TaxID=2589382 RepID=UPI00355B7DA8